MSSTPAGTSWATASRPDRDEPHGTFPGGVLHEEGEHDVFVIAPPSQ